MLTTWIQGKKYLFILCFTVTHFYLCVGLAQTSPLFQLTDEQKEHILAIIRNSTSYAEVREKMSQEMGINVSRASIHQFITRENERYETGEPITLRQPIALRQAIALKSRAWSDLSHLTASQALEHAMIYYFSLRLDVPIEQEPTLLLFAPQLPFYERDFSLMAVPIDQSRGALLAFFEQIRSRNNLNDADLIDMARRSGKIALYRFQTDEPRVTALFEPHLESQNPLQGFSDSQLADHIDQQYNRRFVFASHRDFDVIFQAWKRESMSSLNTHQDVPNTSMPYHLSDELRTLLYQVLVPERLNDLRKDIRSFLSIKKESLERLSGRGYSPEFIRELDRRLFLPYEFFRQVAVVLRIPSGMSPRELSNEQLGQKLTLYSTINYVNENDPPLIKEPLFREASQRLVERNYSFDVLSHIFLATNLPASIIIALNSHRFICKKALSKVH